MSKKYIIQARIFKAMSDENRLKILELLHEREYTPANCWRRWISDSPPSLIICGFC